MNKNLYSQYHEPMATLEAFAGINYMQNLVNNASSGKDAITDLLRSSDQSIIQHNTSSLFNKFTVFQYSPLNAGAVYRADGHFIGYSSKNRTDNTDYELNSQAATTFRKTQLDAMSKGATTADSKAAYDLQIKEYGDIVIALNEKSRAYKNNIKDIQSNPTAKLLIQWGADISASSNVGFQPYSLTDFMFCKNYGRIPNNRLVTLRRYPFPIADSLRLGSMNQRVNAIPIAQAVTWFGSDTENDLDKLGVFSWDMPFTQIVVSEQEIAGNEILLSDLLGLVANVPGGKEIKSTLENLYAAGKGSDDKLQQLAGFDKKMQDYARRLYTTGPYWTRIYGPVNVINESTRRSRGMQPNNWKNHITIKFNYSFRSFNGLSPKIAALDLISNFINLTYNDAQFLNQLPRYFQKTGLKADPTTTELIGNLVTGWGTTFTGNNTENFFKLLSTAISAVDTASSKFINTPGTVVKNTIQTSIMTQLKDAIPEMISIKAALSDKPMGEWHLVVGNPVNPIFVMGDLICTNTIMTWDKEIGPDDFPTGCTFTVTLNQGKPRDKTSIERMLNAGETKLTNGMLKTSSASDTFGTDNSEAWAELQKISETDNGPTALDSLIKSFTGTQLNRYTAFKNRFRLGYGLDKLSADNSIISGASTLDDTLLGLYYHREYGKN